MKKPVRRKGYDQGGQISSNSLGNSISQGFGSVASGYGAIKKAQYYDALTDAQKAKIGAPGPPKGDSVPSGPVGGGDPMARGGKIRRVAGKPIGKDDGLIPAQRGEYVIRKSAVKKLGAAALNQVNRGKLPAKKGR